MKEILTTQFIETITDIGALLLYVTDRDGYTTNVFTGPDGEKKVYIQCSLEYIPESLGANYLLNLGLKEYIERIFPGFFDRLRAKKDLEERDEDGDSNDNDLDED